MIVYKKTNEWYIEWQRETTNDFMFQKKEKGNTIPE